VDDPVLERLTRLHPKLIDLGLERIERLLRAMGDPQFALPPVVHVAGTNGKGSLVAYLRAMAEAAGYRVHVYTSPHLVRFNERIRVAGTPIADELLDEVLTECERANADQPITFFEITTVAAFLAFARTPADLALIEVGMGGRLDTTNVVRPGLTAITPVGFDHTQFLGDTLTKIAGEKAGILKRGAPGVIGRQREESARAIEARARELGVPLFRMGREWQVTPGALGFRYESDLATFDLPRPALAGAHQLDNAATAVACAERLQAAGFALDETAIRRGLATVEWPARLQRLTRGPLVDALPSGCELWLDGGHNEDCGIVLGNMARDWAGEPAALPLHLIFGMLTTKDASGFLRPLARHARSARAVPIEGHAAYTPEQATARATEVGLDCAPAPDVSNALEDLIAGQTPPFRVLICGSLYLAGTVLAKNG